MPSAKATPADKESATTVPAFMVASPLGFHTLPYWRFDALAEYQLNKNISMQLNVVNLTNELYYGALHQSNTPLVFAAPGSGGLLDCKRQVLNTVSDRAVFRSRQGLRGTKGARGLPQE